QWPARSASTTSAHRHRNLRRSGVRLRLHHFSTAERKNDMATERKYNYAGTSQDGQRLTPDEGGADWNLPFDEGAIKGDHIESAESQRPRKGAGFDSPKDDCSRTRGRFGPGDGAFGRDHIDDTDVQEPNFPPGGVTGGDSQEAWSDAPPNALSDWRDDSGLSSAEGFGTSAPKKSK